MIKIGCKFSDFHGICEFYGDGIERECCDSNGACICEDDPNPEDLCEDYIEM